MNIYVNSRIYEQKTTGIWYYIQSLFTKLQNIDKNNYIFLQTSHKKSLWNTYLLPGKSDGIFGIIFDIFSTYIYLLFKWVRKSIYVWSSFFLPFWKVRSIKYIVVIYDLSFLIFPENHSIFFNFCYKYLTLRSINNADEIIAISQNTKNDIIKFYGDRFRDKIKVIYPWINEIFIDIRPTTRLVDGKYIFSVTTHPKRKNIISVIKALGILKLKWYVLKYVIAGLISKDQEIELRSEAKIANVQDQIYLLWYISEKDLISLYQYCEVFIYPSFYEGFWFPIIEAIYSKTLVITSNTSSMKELVIDKNFLVDPRNVDDIVNKIESALDLNESQRNDIIAANLKFAKQFTRSNCSSEYVKLFN